MRWQWPARIVVAAIGVGCAIAIYVSSHGRQRPPDPPTSLASIDPNLSLQGGAGTTDYTKVGRNPVKVSFEHIGKNADGRQWFSGVQVDGLQEHRFSIHGDRMETEGPEDRPARLNISGHVVIVMDDGLHLNADNASYEDATGRLTMPGPVTFTRGRMSGASTGAAYDRDRDAIMLLSAASARVLPDTTGKGSADATSTRMTMVRGRHALTLDGNARIVGDTQVLTSQQAAVQFTDDESAIKTLELTGAARVTPKPGAASADQPDMSGDTIAMTFHADGVSLQHATLTNHAALLMTGAATRSIKASNIDLATAADGKTLTQLDAAGQVLVVVDATATTRGRTITADTMTARGDETKGLTSARFDGSPVFRELPGPAPSPVAGAAAGAPAGELRGEARSLVLTLAGQLDAIESADFDQKVTFVNGDATARGDHGKYVQATGTVHLTPNARDPRVPSHAETPDIRIDAWEIDLHTDTQNLEARRNVTTQSKTPAGAASHGALFEDDKPTNGAADRFAYVKSTGTGTYRGGQAPARLWQGESRIDAGQIDFTDKTRSLQAWGSVDSTWLFDAPADTAAPAPGRKPDLKRYRVRADTLDYDDAARTATFKGLLVALTLPDDGAVESRFLVFRLAKDSRTLEEMRAEQGVWIQQASEGFEADADRFVYHAETDIYDFHGRTGREAILKFRQKDAAHPDAPPANCMRAVGLHLVLNKREGNVEQPERGEASKALTSIPCTTSIRRDR